MRYPPIRGSPLSGSIRDGESVHTLVNDMSMMRLDQTVESDTNTARKIFIGGLAHNISRKALSEYFEKFGKVIDAVVMVDKETERSRGFGFITFFNEASAMNAKK
jgi:RNA recognition motif-containing protein